jgi:acetoacetyl-CoA synthetase
VVAGDRVAAYMPNLPETVVAMLAAASLGAIFTSASPDFGVQGVLDRFGQTEPKVLFACDGYYYNGKTVDCSARSAEIAAQLPSVKRVVVVPYVHARARPLAVPHARLLADFVAPFRFATTSSSRAALRPPALHHVFLGHHRRAQVHRARRRRRAAAAPQGTQAARRREAGRPPVLLHHLRLDDVELAGVRPRRRATLLLYDGSPFVGRGSILFDYADAEAMTHFGTSAKFIDAIAKIGLKPRETHKLEHGARHDVDRQPAGARGLRLRLSRHQGRPAALVDLGRHRHHLLLRARQPRCCRCGAARSSAAASAWRWTCSTTTAGRCAARRANWCARALPGDADRLLERRRRQRSTTPPTSSASQRLVPRRLREITAHGGLIIYGRSDATLNPGGVRIGTAEIYRQVEKLARGGRVLVIGQDWPPQATPTTCAWCCSSSCAKGLRSTTRPDRRIKQVIRDNTTPRHVPAKVLQVADIPRTKSGKIVELAVRNVVHGRR